MTSEWTGEPELECGKYQSDCISQRHAARWHQLSPPRSYKGAILLISQITSLHFEHLRRHLHCGDGVSRLAHAHLHNPKGTGTIAMGSGYLHTVLLKYGVIGFLWLFCGRHCGSEDRKMSIVLTVVFLWARMVQAYVVAPNHQLGFWGFGG